MVCQLINKAALVDFREFKRDENIARVRACVRACVCVCETY